MGLRGKEGQKRPGPAASHCPAGRRRLLASPIPRYGRAPGSKGTGAPGQAAVKRGSRKREERKIKEETFISYQGTSEPSSARINFPVVAIVKCSIACNTLGAPSSGVTAGKSCFPGLSY